MKTSIVFSPDFNHLSTNEVNNSGTESTNSFDLTSTHGALFSISGGELAVSSVAPSSSTVLDTITIGLEGIKLRIHFDKEREELRIVGTTDLDTFIYQEDWAIPISSNEARLKISGANLEVNIYG